MLEQADGMAGMASSMLEPIGLGVIQPFFVQRGDVACLTVPDGTGAFATVGAVCIGGAFTVLEKQGLRSIPLTVAVKKLSAKVWGLR